MSFWQRMFARPQKPRPMLDLYGAIVAQARAPRWYAEHGVADTIDGRFDMLVLVLALVLTRLDHEGEPLRQAAVDLTERFIDDMDGQIREMGIGDFVVGKHVGKMMGALGGRIDAYRAGLEGGGDLQAALARNLYRDAPPPAAVLAATADAVRRLNAAIAGRPLDRLLAGDLGL